MRGQYVFILGLLAALFGYGAFNLVFGTSEAAMAVGHAVVKALPSPIPTAAAVFKSGPEGIVPEESLTLSRSNTIAFRSVVTPLSVAQAQQALLEKNKKLKPGQPIYIVLDTPGGDISAGTQLTDTALGLGRPVHTITNFAASMGFYIAQRLGTRYILPSGTLMAHRARVEGVGGQVPGEFLTAVGMIYRQVTKLEMQNAARLGISFEAYTALVKDEKWWTGADEAVSEGAADAQVSIKCDDSLSGSTIEHFETFFGSVAVTFADCPAITAPLKVKFDRSGLSFEEQRDLTSNVNKLRHLLTNSLKQ